MPFPQKLGSENEDKLNRQSTKRPGDGELGPLPDSFDDDDVWAPNQTTKAQPALESSTGPMLFKTASNKEIKVKQSSLDAARKRLRLDEDLGVYSQWIEQDLDNGKKAVEAPPSFIPTSFGFQTAGCKPIGVSEAAMQKAKKLIESAEADSENLASFIQKPAQTSGLTAINSKGFISPFTNTQNNTVLAPPVPNGGSPNRFRTPFRPPSFVSPLVAGKPETPKPSTSSFSFESAQRPWTPKVSTPVNSAKFGTPTAFQTGPAVASGTLTAFGTPTSVKTKTAAPVTPASTSTHFGTPGSSRVSIPGTPATPVSNFPPLSLISLSQAENYVNDVRGIDVIGLVDNSPVRQKRDSGLFQISFLLKDDSCPSVKCDLFRRSDPGPLNKGDVVLLRKVMVKRIQGRITLNAVVKSGLEMNPDCPEADRLKGGSHGREPVTPMVVQKITTKDDDEFSYSDLKCIDRLKPGDADAVVKGHLHEIKRESLTYLGCIKCKRKINTVDDFDDEVSCVSCGSTECRHFFSVKAHIYDFSGILKVSIFDEIFMRLIEEDAEDISHLEKYNPDALSEKLFSVEYAKPRLFRLRRREDDWVVEDFKEINYTAFNEFLGAIIKKKGYPIPKFPH